jgi:hypothetical protein
MSLATLLEQQGLQSSMRFLPGIATPMRWPHFRDPRIRASNDTIAKSLVGDYRPEHLFTLRQSVDLYREYQQRIAACEDEMQRFMKGMESNATSSASLPVAKDSVRKCKVMIPAKALALREQAYRILGVDLTAIPAISVLHVQTILAELGDGISKFRSASAFSSWMGYARTTILVAEECFGPERERSKTVLPSRSEWQLNRYKRVNRL